jgi:hypothetical protein
MSLQPRSRYQLGRHRWTFVTVTAQPPPTTTRLPIPGSGVGFAVGFAVGAGQAIGPALAGATNAGRSVGYVAGVSNGT